MLPLFGIQNVFRTVHMVTKRKQHSIRKTNTGKQARAQIHYKDDGIMQTQTEL